MLNTKGASRLVAGARSISRNVTKRRNGTSNMKIALPASRRSIQQLQQSMFYTTERVLEFRSGKKKAEQSPTLYNPENETENCGVGLVASLKSVPSRRVVEQADEMLVRMSHRGGCGCDPASGDGAGK